MIIQVILNAFRKRKKLQPPRPTLDGSMTLKVLHFDLSNNQKLANMIIKENCKKLQMI